MTLLKYPRTRHIEGSRLQVGDIGDDKPVAELQGVALVIEEKVDGANCGLSFDSTGKLMLQSRGQYLGSGWRERHFDMFKTWASTHAFRFYNVLGDRYVMYGEWMYAKHTVFYDNLPHYFLEFDVFDRQSGSFLSTRARAGLLSGLPVMPVPVVYRGVIKNVGEIPGLVKQSLYKTTQWQAALDVAIERSDSRAEFVEKQTEHNRLAEGVYIKHEQDGVVLDRFKYVRGDFVQAINASDSHWQDRPLLPNKLDENVDIFAPVLGISGAYDGLEIEE